MATLTDRPKSKTPAPPRPSPRPRTPPQGPLEPSGPGRQPEPNRRRDRVQAYLYLFGPVAGVLLGALALLAVILVLVLGSGAAPPATGAARLVPANALLYVHVSTDPSRSGVSQALTVSRRLPDSPLLFASVTNRLDAILAGSATAPVNFSTDVRPWLGREAALAVLDTPGASAGTLIVLDVRDRRAAQRFLVRGGAQPNGSFRGVPLLAQGNGTVLAFDGHYLLAGQAASVEAAIYVADGKAPSLAASHQYQGVAGHEPADRVLDLYASADGVRRALLPQSGALGDLGALLDQPALRATSISVSAVATGLRIDVHSSLFPKLATAPANRPVQFSPTLDEALPAHSVLLLDVKGLRASVPKLLGVAARAGILGRLAPLLSRLGGALRAEGVDPRQVLNVFSGETAIALAPGQNGGGPVPVIVTRTTHPAQTAATLASVAGPLKQVFTPGAGSPGGQVPEETVVGIGGVPVHELSLSPGLGLDYAVAHGLVIVSTEPAGIADLLGRHTSIGAAPAFRSTIPGPVSRVTSLVFFDLSQLQRLGDQTGLIGGARQATLRAVAEKIRAVGLESWRGAEDTTTRIQLQIP